MKRLFALVAVLSLAGCTVTDPVFVQFEGIKLASASAQPTTTPSSGSIDYVVDQSAEIEIEDQTGSGLSVLIEEIKVGRDGTFLVIYDSTGLVLASTMVSPQSQPVMVPLDIPISKSQELQAALYLDNGDGAFSLNSDSPLIDYEGDLVHEDFDYELVSQND
jgi:hypothetical protein